MSIQEDVEPGNVYKNFEFKFEVACPYAESSRITKVLYELHAPREGSSPHVYVDELEFETFVDAKTAITILESYLGEEDISLILESIRLGIIDRENIVKDLKYEQWQLLEEDAINKTIFVKQTLLKKRTSYTLLQKYWPRGMSLNNRYKIIAMKTEEFVTEDGPESALYLRLSASSNPYYGIRISKDFIKAFFDTYLYYGRICSHNLLNPIQYKFSLPSFADLQKFLTFQAIQRKLIIYSYDYYNSVYNYLAKSFEINTILRMRLENIRNPELAYQKFILEYPDTEQDMFQSNYHNAKNLVKMLQELDPLPFDINVYRTLQFSNPDNTVIRLTDRAITSTSLVPCGFEVEGSSLEKKHVMLKIRVHAGVRVFFPLSYSIGRYYQNLMAFGIKNYYSTEFSYGDTELEVMCEPNCQLVIQGNPFIIHGAENDLYMYSADMYPPGHDSRQEVISLPPAKRRRI